jgi:hypothetical protein
MAPAISIPNELWEEYRPLLTDLFREKTLKEVMNYMGIHKSFYARFVSRPFVPSSTTAKAEVLDI